MAFITAEQVKVKRNAIKKLFPLKEGWKFSVTKDNHSLVDIRLMQYPKEYNFGTKSYNYPVNHYWFTQEGHAPDGWGSKEIEVFRKINEIAHDGHWDKSDSMTDYFHCAYYISMGVGKWDRPAVAV